MKVRQSAKMSRLVKGDVFNDGDDMLMVQGWPERKSDGRIQIPVLRVGFGGVRSKRPLGRASRRHFDGDVRVALV